jgi:ATP-binding cassette subfamily B multidrug efflux pump
MVMRRRRPATTDATAATGAGPDQQGSGMLTALRRAFRYLGPHRSNVIGALIAVLFVTVTNLLAPQLVRIAIDSGIATHDSRVIVLAVLGIFGLALVRGAATFIQGFLSERGSQGVARDLRDDFFVKIERLGFDFHDRTPTGQLLTRATSDIEQVRFVTGNGFVNIVSSAIQIVAIVVLLFVTNWQLALITFVSVLIIVGLLVRFGSSIAPLFTKIQMALGQLNSTLQEDLVGLRTIRAFRGEERERERYRGHNERMFDLNIDIVRLFSVNFRAIFLVAGLASLAVVYAGGRQVIGGDLEVGALVAFYQYLNFLLGPILTLGFLGSAVPRAGASAVRIFAVLDEPVTIADRPGAEPLPPVTGRVTFDDVSFRYPEAEHDALHGVSFTAEPGQTVAIIGTTGSGKSTLVNLIPRFHDPTAGAVRIDGHDLHDVTLDSLREQVASVLQESRLFSGTVRENIAYGRPDATMAEIRAAAEAAQAAPFIEAMADGYETIIGERGVGLSGGQRQRVAIARALLADRAILILDDSTSAVDATTESEIRAAIDRLLAERRRTTFVIAQRVSTVRSADVILVMDAGRIVDQGTHDELLANSPLYVSILGSQLNIETAFAPDESIVDEVAELELEASDGPIANGNRLGVATAGAPNANGRDRD